MRYTTENIALVYGSLLAKDAAAPLGARVSVTPSLDLRRVGNKDTKQKVYSMLHLFGRPTKTMQKAGSFEEMRDEDLEALLKIAGLYDPAAARQAARALTGGSKAPVVPAVLAGFQPRLGRKAVSIGTAVNDSAAALQAAKPSFTGGSTAALAGFQPRLGRKAVSIGTALKK